MTQRRGVSLAEAIIALFVLTSAIAMLGGLLQSGLHSQVRSQRRLLAIALAQKKVTEIRAWARQNVSGSSYHFDDPVADWVSRLTAPDPEFPGYTVQARVAGQTLFSPCTSSEAPYVPLGTARQMTNSARRVKVSVADPSDPGWSADLVTLVCDPTRDLHPTRAVNVVMVSSLPSSLSPAGPDLLNPLPGSSLDMRAEALYPDGREVTDLFFDWYIVPLGGTGTLHPSRDGRTCRFVNGVATGLNVITTEGKSVVALHGVYRGQGQAPQDYNVLSPNPYIGISPILQLGP